MTAAFEGPQPEDLFVEHTVCEKRIEGTDVITTVIMDGEVMVFQIPSVVFEAARKLGRTANE